MNEPMVYTLPPAPLPMSGGCWRCGKAFEAHTGDALRCPRDGGMTRLRQLSEATRRMHSLYPFTRTVSAVKRKQQAAASPVERTEGDTDA